ncbi:MAG: choice-of-anchor tandem repeat GloVer-containing protein [Bryobacteraceae bacterium]
MIGGTLGGGVVFSLTEAAGTWTYDVIYNLPPSSVISSPTGLTLGGNGVLYGTAAPGSAPDSGGIVYSLTPPISSGGVWTENTLYSFGSVADDGLGPQCVVVGNNGSLYGVTSDGGTGGFGTVFSLTPPVSSGGTWTEDQIYSFPFNGATGAPTTLAIGPHGVLYGTTSYIGGSTVSEVFAIEP